MEESHQGTPHPMTKERPLTLMLEELDNDGQRSHAGHGVRREQRKHI
jgi:hypothetical protein